MIATSTPSQWVSSWQHDRCILLYIDSEVEEQNEVVGGSEVNEGMEEEEEALQSLSGAGVNKVSVRRTSVAIPQGSGVGCNTTSPFVGSRQYFSN